MGRHIPIRNYHDPKNHRSNHIVSSATRRDESASPKQDSSRSGDSSDCWIPTTPTTKSIPKVDSAGSSLSSCGSIPPPSPGLTLSPPVISNPPSQGWHPDQTRRLTTPPTTPPWVALKTSNNGANANKFPTTPPPQRKHSTGIQVVKDCDRLIKSKSHESELTNRINPGNANAVTVKDIPISPTTTQANSTPFSSRVEGEVRTPAAVTSETPKPSLSSGVTGLMSTVSSSSYTISTTSATAMGMRSSVSDMPLNTGETSNATGFHTSADQPINHKPVFRQGKRTQTEHPPPVAVLDHINSGGHSSGIEGPSPIASPRSPPTFFDGSETMPIAHSTLQVPKSPRTPRSMGHLIKHRFTKTFKPGKCDYCSDYMFNGLKCKECKYRCHRDCESHVPPSCGLPEDLLRHYINQLTKDGSPILTRLPVASTDPNLIASLRGPAGIPGVGYNPSMHIDSSSNTSSCNSSTPSSPAVLVTSHPTPPHSASVYQNTKTKFTFPDPPITIKMQPDPSQIPLIPSSKATSPNPIIDSVRSNDSDKTLSGTSGSSGSAGTAIRLNSQDSTASVDDAGSPWNATRQTSISLREWDIPYEELKIADKIGSGRFSTVHQGHWHGDVAVKV